jgi:DNA-binding MarR family transcriptional regulator
MSTAKGPADGAAPSLIRDPSTPAGQLGLAFKRATVAIRKLRGRETHRPGQLSYAQYRLLFGLAGTCECSSRELAEQAELTPATVTEMLDHLESAGLVARTRSERDRRVVLSTLTERGARVVAERRAQLEPRWEATLAEFSDRELTAAARVLDKIADYFNTLPDDRIDDPHTGTNDGH